MFKNRIKRGNDFEFDWGNFGFRVKFIFEFKFNFIYKINSKRLYFYVGLWLFLK